MTPRFLTVTTLNFTGDVEDQEKLKLICLVANQHDKRNPYTVIVKIEETRNGKLPFSILKSGEGLEYRQLESYKQAYKRYGWEVVPYNAYQDEKSELINFNDPDGQIDIFNRLCEEVEVNCVTETFEMMQMPFNHTFINTSGYESFGEWA